MSVPGVFSLSVARKILKTGLTEHCMFFFYMYLQYVKLEPLIYHLKLQV